MTDARHIHTHGLSARVTLHGDADYDTILRKLEWSPRHRGWVRSEPKGGTRWQLRSSAWLTGRRASRTSGLGKRNRRWGTAIASLNVQHGAAGWAIDIETVRRDDIPTLMGKVLGLGDEQWHIAYPRKLERFVCLCSRDAFRLALARGLREEPVRGERDGCKKTWRKAHLVRPAEWSVPVRVRTRSRADVDVVLYQVAGGATAGTWKLEARLQRKTNQLPFDEADCVRALDGVLDDIIHEYGISPVEKPARWEPRRSSDNRRTAGDIAGLPMACWRGPEPACGKFDTPPTHGDPLDGLCLVWSKLFAGQGLSTPCDAAEDGSPAGGGGISSHSSCYDSPPPGDERVYPGSRSRGTRPTSGSTSSPVEQLLARPGTLVEVIHGKDDDPLFVAEMVMSNMRPLNMRPLNMRPSSSVPLNMELSGMFSASVLTAKSMAAQIRRNIHLAQWLADHPLDAELLALVEDEGDAIADLTACVWFIMVDEMVLCPPPAARPVGEDGEVDLEAEAKFIEGLIFEPDHKPLARRMESHLARLLHGLRVLCDRTGLRVVLLSPEARPAGASLAPDRDLRSLTGDAGRYYAHLRLYQPRGCGIVEVWKDEVEGLGPGWLTPGGKSGGQMPDVHELVQLDQQAAQEPPPAVLEAA